MKKTLLIITSFLLLSCKSKIDKNIEEYFMKYGHNPESYEPISTKCGDTIYYKENYIDLITSLTSDVKSDSTDIGYYNSSLKYDTAQLSNDKKEYHNEEGINESDIYSINRDKEEISERKKTLIENEIKLKKAYISLDSLKKSANPNAIFGYRFMHEFRARVPLGGEMLKRAFVQTDKDFNIIQLSEYN